MKKQLFLIVWIAVIIFPLNFIEKNSPQLSVVLKQFIEPEWVHIVGHTTLFAGLVILVGIVFQLELTLVNTLFLASMVTALGSLQELFQLIVKNRPPGWPEFFDIGVDGFGGIIGWGLYFSIRYFIFDRRMITNKIKSIDYSLWSW